MFCVESQMFRSHPVLGWDESERKTAIAISIHGDEGQTKRGRNLLLISWSALAVSGESLYYKYPIIVFGLLLKIFLNVWFVSGFQVLQLCVCLGCKLERP